MKNNWLDELRDEDGSLNAVSVAVVWKFKELNQIVNRSKITTLAY
jgi:hypothetical protein